MTKSLEQGIFFQGILLFLMFLDIFCNKKCLETGETTKYLEQAIFFKEYYCFSCFFNTRLWPAFVSGNRKTTKPLEKIIIFKGFSCFWTLLITKKMSKTWETTISLEKKRLAQDIMAFLLFLDTFLLQKMSRNMRNYKVPWINDFLKVFCRFICF